MTHKGQLLIRIRVFQPLLSLNKRKCDQLIDVHFSSGGAKTSKQGEDILKSGRKIKNRANEVYI
jgi:hypothetical protein